MPEGYFNEISDKTHSAINTHFRLEMALFVVMWFEKVLFTTQFDSGSRFYFSMVRSIQYIIFKKVVETS